MLVELRSAPTVFGPLGAGMTLHGQAVVGRSVHQELGEVKFLLSTFHTATLAQKRLAVDRLFSGYLRCICGVFAGYLMEARAFSMRSSRLDTSKGLVT